MQYLVIYPGRFHPFHKGHKSVYDTLVNKFGANNVFIATSDKVDPPKSPFSFEEKLKMINLTGVPSKNVVRVKNPYQATEIVSKYDPKDTVLLFAVSEKDMEEDPRFAFKPKKDGSPSYFQPANDKMEPLEKHGYILTVPTLRFTLLGKPLKSASEFRSQFAKASASVQKQMIQDLYGTYSLEIHNLLDQKIKENLHEDVTQADLDQLEQFADKLFGKVGIDVEFTKHFLDRVNDERNRKPVTPAELTRLFKQEYKRYGKPIAKMGPDKEAVMKDLQTNLNLPFALVYDRQNNELDLIAKTIMRKDNFKTPNQVFAVETGGVGIVTKQNATKDVPVGGEYMNVKKLGLGKGPKELHKKARKNSDPNTLMNLGIGEKITKDTPMGDVIKDFYKSDAPQFKGKSKAKRRQMAIAAKLSALESALHELKERHDQLKGTHKFTKSAKPGGKESPHPARGLLVGNKISEGKRIPRKKGQPAGSKKHSDLYTDENPKGTIHGLKFATVKDAKASVSKIRNSGKTHAHKIQAAVAMEQRAKAAGKRSAAGVYRTFINAMKKKTKKKNETKEAPPGTYFTKTGNLVKGTLSKDAKERGARKTDPKDDQRSKVPPVTQYNENFADGKVKGKSRPGRVKRAGASCKGSVTELRAKAKKASGEKAKMYHWCANMKSGKK